METRTDCRYGKTPRGIKNLRMVAVPLSLTHLSHTHTHTNTLVPFRACIGESPQHTVRASYVGVCLRTCSFLHTHVERLMSAGKRRTWSRPHDNICSPTPPLTKDARVGGFTCCGEVKCRNAEVKRSRLEFWVNFRSNQLVCGIDAIFHGFVSNRRNK